LSVQRETGGNLSETLENLSDIIRRRRQLKLKVRALSSEARASALILGMLPFVLFVIISFIRPDYTAQLFNDPRGMMMTVAGLMSQAIGIAVMIKMIRFEI
jgi:tight adherence protein B